MLGWVNWLNLVRLLLTCGYNLFGFYEDRFIATPAGSALLPVHTVQSLLKFRCGAPHSLALFSVTKQFLMRDRLEMAVTLCRHNSDDAHLQPIARAQNVSTDRKLAEMRLLTSSEVPELFTCSPLATCLVCLHSDKSGIVDLV
jgi:hypothetical protein